MSRNPRPAGSPKQRQMAWLHSLCHTVQSNDCGLKAKGNDVAPQPRCPTQRGLAWLHLVSSQGRSIQHCIRIPHLLWQFHIVLNNRSLKWASSASGKTDLCTLCAKKPPRTNLLCVRLCDPCSELLCKELWRADIAGIAQSSTEGVTACSRGAPCKQGPQDLYRFKVTRCSPAAAVLFVTTIAIKSPTM